MQKPDEYYARMDSAKNDKLKVLDFIQDGDKILDIGAGSGIVSMMLVSMFPNSTVDAIELDENACRKLSDTNEVLRAAGARFSCHNTDFFTYASEQDVKYDAIVMSSVIHEIYSYTPYNGRMFNKDIIPHIIETATKMLQPGGRIIIRDAVLPNGYDEMVKSLSISCLCTARGSELKELACEYVKKNDTSIVPCTDTPATPRFFGSCEDIINLMLSINWGRASFERESNERLAYYSAEDWEKLENCDLYLDYFVEYLQAGYETHLAPYMNYNDNERFPKSNALIVFKKNSWSPKRQKE